MTRFNWAFWKKMLVLNLPFQSNNSALFENILRVKKMIKYFCIYFQYWIFI